MLPWGHLAVGYLCYTFYLRIHRQRPPEGSAVIALVIGTQFPDLIDKPLGWTVGLLPSGRSLGHSLLFALLLGVVLWTVARRIDRRTAVGAFLVGHLSHGFADAVPAALAGEWARIGFLLWPITPVYQYPEEADRTIIGFFAEIGPSDLPTAGVVLFILTVGLWIYEGTPGLAIVVETVRTGLRR